MTWRTGADVKHGAGRRVTFNRACRYLTHRHVRGTPAPDGNGSKGVGTALIA